MCENIWNGADLVIFPIFKTQWTLPRMSSMYSSILNYSQPQYGSFCFKAMQFINQ